MCAVLQEIAGAELQTALQKTKEAENKVIKENEEDSNEETAEDESIEMIAAQCVSIVHLRLPAAEPEPHEGPTSRLWAADPPQACDDQQLVGAREGHGGEDRGHGLVVWRDEEGLRPGTNLQRAMLEAVEGAVLVLVSYSLPYYRSRNC